MYVSVCLLFILSCLSGDDVLQPFLWRCGQCTTLCD